MHAINGWKKFTVIGFEYILCQASRESMLLCCMLNPIRVRDKQTNIQVLMVKYSNIFLFFCIENQSFYSVTNTFHLLL